MQHYQSNSPLKAWSLRLRHTETLQEMKVLAFGKSAESARQHVFDTVPPDDWEVIDLFPMNNRRAVFFVIPNEVATQLIGN